MTHALRAVTFALLICALAGCDAADPGESDLAKAQFVETEIPLGQTVQISGLSVTFNQVIEDVRCPADVLCVWAGSASVALTIDETPADLAVVHPGSAERGHEGGLQIGSVVVYAVGLTPYPSESNPSEETAVVTVATVSAE